MNNKNINIKSDFIKNMYSEKIKDNRISRPMTPSEWMGCERVPMTIIEITYGGGLGGSCQTLYCERIEYDNFVNTKTIKVTTLDKKTILLNTRYIVFVDNNYECLKAYLNSRNPNFPMGVYEYRYKIENNQDVVLQQ